MISFAQADLQPASWSEGHPASRVILWRNRRRAPGARRPLHIATLVDPSGHRIAAPSAGQLVHRHRTSSLSSNPGSVTA